MESAYTQYKRMSNRLLESKESEIEDLKLQVFRLINMVRALEYDNKVLTGSNVGLGEAINQKTDLILKMQKDGYKCKEN